MKRIIMFLGAILLLVSCKLPADIAGISVHTPDLSHVADGTWRGVWETSLIKAQVAVMVEKGKIENITLERHEHGRGGAAVSILDKVIKEQRLEVDAVAGATGSSKVILKAIEQALVKGSK